MKQNKSLFDEFTEIYKIMADNVPAIMEESGKPFCDKCAENFIKRMKELCKPQE